ncbi:hypothetical protein CR513_54376, partial [Mucuna pruriens]
MERNKREERRERHGRRGEAREEELDMSSSEACHPRVWWLCLDIVDSSVKGDKDLNVKIQRLHQGPFSMEQYHKKMEIDLLRA